VSDNQTIIGGYELKNCVASGASTQIWEVTQQGATTPFAMKLLLPDAMKSPEAKAVLKHEFKVGSALEHPNLVRLHRMELNRDHGFFIMDYFRAPSLKAQISANLPETQSRFKKIVEAACQAFVHMNEKGWMHRDIKPDNILVNKTGEVRVIDFSLACRIATGIMKLLAGKQKSIMGTRTYIAPEIILKKPPTVQSDIYSLGVTLFEIATGVPPFAGMSPSDLLKKHIGEAAAPPSLANPNVTGELDTAILRMLAKKPKDRPADMREVMSIFRNIKCFKEDPFELYERKVKDAKANESLSVDKRLDSRADADRVSRGIAAPAKPTKGKRLTAPIGEMEAVKKLIPGKGAAAAAPVPQPQMPGMQMMPQSPYGMPGAPVSGMMYPGMPMMQQPMMQPMPQYPGGMPGQPMMPPNMMPQPQSPQQPQISQKPQVIQPQAAQSQATQPQPAPQKPQVPVAQTAKNSVAPSPAPPEDLDYMTDLPDIS
jgi:serine/threonine-protein kinase